MATFERFEDIEAWQRARELNRSIYRITRDGAFRRDFDLIRQLRRAGVSVMSNIAEGFERDGSGEFLQFLSTAKGSSGEIRSQLYTALDEQYIDADTFNQLRSQAEHVSRMIMRLMQYLRRSGIKGSKYKPPET